MSSPVSFTNSQVSSFYKRRQLYGPGRIGVEDTWFTEHPPHVDDIDDYYSPIGRYLVSRRISYPDESVGEYYTVSGHLRCSGCSSPVRHFETELECVEWANAKYGLGNFKVLNNAMSRGRKWAIRVRKDWAQRKSGAFGT